MEQFVEYVEPGVRKQTTFSQIKNRTEVRISLFAKPLVPEKQWYGWNLVAYLRFFLEADNPDIMTQSPLRRDDIAAGTQAKAAELYACALQDISRHPAETHRSPATLHVGGMSLRDPLTGARAIHTHVCVENRGIPTPVASYSAVGVAGGGVTEKFEIQNHPRCTAKQAEDIQNWLDNQNYRN